MKRLLLLLVLAVLFLTFGCDQAQNVKEASLKIQSFLKEVGEKNESIIIAEDPLLPLIPCDKQPCGSRT
jgi:hypothetical protein